MCGFVGKVSENTVASPFDVCDVTPFGRLTKENRWTRSNTELTKFSDSIGRITGASRRAVFVCISRDRMIYRSSRDFYFPARIPVCFPFSSILCSAGRESAPAGGTRRGAENKGRHHATANISNISNIAKGYHRPNIGSMASALLPGSDEFLRSVSCATNSRVPEILPGRPGLG